jgi:hypothetical protein
MSGHRLTHDRQPEPEAVTIPSALDEGLEQLLDIARGKPVMSENSSDAQAQAAR